MDDDPWAQAPNNAPEAASKTRSLRLPAVAVVTALFVLGAAVSVALPFYFDGGTPQTGPVAVRAAWDPGSGPLVQGLKLPSSMPDTLAWSPDAKQLAWVAYDPERKMPVVWLVGVGQGGFGGLQKLETEPSWLRRGTPAAVTARVEGDVVALRWADGPKARETAGVVDLPGMFGLTDTQAPAVITVDSRTLLAVTARLPEQSASPTLHVFDITKLIAPPAPATPPTPPGAAAPAAPAAPAAAAGQTPG